MFQQLYSLAKIEQWILLRSAILIPLTALGVRLLGFNRWYAWLDLFTQPTRLADLPKDSDKEIIIRRTLRMVGLASRRGLYAGNCLSRSLTLWWLLRHQGLCADLRIGTRQLDGNFQAHAWVEYNGYPLNESTQVHEQYIAFEQKIVPSQLTQLRAGEWRKVRE